MMERSRSSLDIIGILQKEDKRLASEISLVKNRDQSIPDWIDVTAFSGAWVNYGGSGSFAEDTAGYWRSSTGLVLLKGVVKNGLIPGDLLVLPIGFRPAFLKRFPIISNGVFGIASVSAVGIVRVEAGSNIKVELSGIAFRSEQ
jgi:hypothetical protein